MVRFVLAAALALAVSIFSTNAEARRADGWWGFQGFSEPGFRPERRKRAKAHRHHAREHRRHARNFARLSRGRTSEAPTYRAGVATRILAHPAGCPRVAFCGCGVARWLGIRNRSLWLAANWLRFPPARPGPGMVAARRGHVFAIVRLLRPGLVLAYDPNSGGHMTRLHARRLAGFSVRNPRGG